jgi:hypothetical protein
MDLAAARLREKERAERLVALREQHARLDAARAAAEAAAAARQRGHAAAALAAALMVMEAALEDGGPLAPALALLAAAAPGDALVAAAVGGVPSAAAAAGAAPRAALAAALDAAAPRARALALVPAEGASMAARLLALAASALRVPEPTPCADPSADDMIGTEELPLPGGGVEAVLSRARRELAAGRLGAAADALEMGTKQATSGDAVAEGAAGAAEEVAPLVAALRARAAAEAAHEALRAHAATLLAAAPAV